MFRKTLLIAIAMTTKVHMAMMMKAMPMMVVATLT